MKPTVYIAAPWIEKTQARIVASAFEAAGFEVTKKWWEHREVPGYLVDDHDNAELVEQAMEDIAGVAHADVFVLLNLGKSEGKAVETGLAIAWNIPIVLVGAKSNLFHYLHDVRVVESIADAIPLCLSLAGAYGNLRESVSTVYDPRRI